MNISLNRSYYLLLITYYLLLKLPQATDHNQKGDDLVGSSPWLICEQITHSALPPIYEP